MTDILFDLEGKFKGFLDSISTPNQLGLKEGKKAEAPTPQPEKIVPPQEPTPTPQPPQKTYVEGSPQQRTWGNPNLIRNEPTE